MIEPARALVRPRVVSPETGDVVLLEDEAADWLADRKTLALEIVGGAGLGKTTSLAHLAATLISAAPVSFLDEPTQADVIAAIAAGKVVYAASEPMKLDHAYSLRLASWSDDELIEYLRAAHPAHCGSVMQRVRASSVRRRLRGVPELWRIVLDELVADESAREVFEVLRRRWLAPTTTTSKTSNRRRKSANPTCVARTCWAPSSTAPILFGRSAGRHVQLRPGRALPPLRRDLVRSCELVMCSSRH